MPITKHPVKLKVIITPIYAVLVYIFLSIPTDLQAAHSFVDDDMLDRLKQQYKLPAKQRGDDLNVLLYDVESETVNQQLAIVNRYFNVFLYKEDIKLWGKEDYWATPEEFIGVHSGDCEDYVIAKYFTLRYLGVPDEKLYLTYVKALRQNIAHMVLSYFETPKSIPLVLDNYNINILPANKRSDLLPVYSFNAKSLFLANASAGLGRALPTGKIKNNKWKRLLANINRSNK